MDGKMESAQDDYARLLLEHIENAEAVLVGAASGMSAAAGHRFYYEGDETFRRIFGKFADKYGFRNAFEGFYYCYPTTEERWAFISTFVKHIYEVEEGKPYHDLAKLMEGRNFHVLTTNQDTLMERVFPEDKVSAIQGDWRYFQCRRRCHDELYYNRDMVDEMYAAIDGTAIPSELVPRCPKCGGEMEPWVRGFDFLEGEKYVDEHRKLNRFIEGNKDKEILFLELGVGRMTPMFIQQPFWNMTYALPKAFYINVNPKDACMPRQLEGRGALIPEDIAIVLADAVELKEKAAK